MAAGQFRSSAWDPILITSQMITMQCIFYVGLGLATILVNSLTGGSLYLDQLFSYEVLNFKDLRGELLIVTTILNSLIGGVGLWYVIQRTKQCWDFSSTVYITHMLVCWLVNGHLTRSIFWWVTMLFSGVIMTVLGEYLCMRSEIQAIPLTGVRVEL